MRCHVLACPDPGAYALTTGPAAPLVLCARHYAGLLPDEPLAQAPVKVLPPAPPAAP